MSTGATIVVIVVAVIVLGLVVWYAWTQARRKMRVRERPLAPEARDRFAQEWSQIQAHFVDNPATAVGEADRLVTVVMGERGYPTEDYQRQLADLSVRHGSTLGHYRTAHDLKLRNDQHQASTEELREAMVHYRALFEDLVQSDVDDRHGDGDTRHPRGRHDNATG
jgi:uncharacterized protein HemX